MIRNSIIGNSDDGHLQEFSGNLSGRVCVGSSVSLLDGIAYDYGEKKKFIKSVHNFENDILVASKNIAKRYSTGKDHIKGTTDIALTIFDSMKKVHGMGARERLLLQIAVQLHDCGKYISMADGC